MAVPTPPTAGEPIAEAWGDVVHDAVVAMDIQSGVTNVSLAAQSEASVTVVFPRPFAAPPVICMGMPEIGGTTQRPVTAKWNSKTATQFGCLVQTGGGAITAGPFPVNWIAYGPRA